VDVKLPSVGLGYHVIIDDGFLTDGRRAVDVFRTRLQGWGARGALGYILPPGNFSPALGSNLRVEVGATFVAAKGTQATGSSVNTQDVSVLSVAGTGASSAFLCNAVTTFVCTTASSLQTDYQSWTIFGKAASDYNFGLVTLTPSLAVFGGAARINQNLATSFNQFRTTTGATNFSNSYAAAMQTKWTDVGARFGMEWNWQVTSWLSFGSGGYIGFASRNASLTASDVETGAPTFFNIASTISPTASTTAMVANYEYGVNIKPSRNVVLRGFAGVNWDSAVPGISTPTYAGNITPTGRTPSTIVWHDEASYYAGAGATIRW
jgi:hypothetical protein